MNSRLSVLTLSLTIVLAGCAGVAPSPMPTSPSTAPTTTPWSLLVRAPGSITWERSGGIAGVCQQFVVRADGSYVLRDSCRSTEPQAGQLSQAEVGQLKTWFSTFQPFDWSTSTQPGSADMFSVKLQFSGRGTTPASDADQSMIVATIGQWASGLTVPATPPPAPASGQGIEGRATLGPTCPVARAENPCPEKPYQGTLQVLDFNGKLVTEFSTAADGSFSVALPPGDYTIQGTSRNVFPRAPRTDVTVAPGQFTQIDLTFDTGIR